VEAALRLNSTQLVAVLHVLHRLTREADRLAAEAGRKAVGLLEALCAAVTSSETAEAALLLAAAMGRADLIPLLAAASINPLWPNWSPQLAHDLQRLIS
jgi:hypothetical protein